MLENTLSVGRPAFMAALLALSGWGPCPEAAANPAGGTATRGTAAFSSSGNQLTVTTSDRATIAWQSFNIGAGQTTTFVQPSASSVVWNQINDPNPSQILGNLNANGLVVLQNPSGFFLGGQAVLNAQGLVMTTSPTPAPDLFSGGAWQFNALPPSASILNYGKINLGSAGSAFLIAQDIQNHGSITAPGGSIGLYSGQQVSLSTRPDGRGLTAQVTLPQGAVNNQGQLVADAGTIALQARVVNQGGLIQANSVRSQNGVIELIAADAVTLGADSLLSARGFGQGISGGGSITVKSGGGFTDTAGSVLNISGGEQGGQAGGAEISAAYFSELHSRIDGHAAQGYRGGTLLLDPYDLLINSALTGSLVPTLNSGLYQINLPADHNITLAGIWTLTDPGAAARLSLQAGNSIIFNNGAGIKAGNNWSVYLKAGPENLLARPDTMRTGGIYLDGNSYVDALNGRVSLWAANEVLINSGAVRTRTGGSIDVTALLGDVNSGVNFYGYTFGRLAAPYYIVNSTRLGGISTAAGGDVTITAGGNVTSYLPLQNNYNEAQYGAGSGAFGSQPGNVTVTAGGNVLGNYVLANGIGTITSGGTIGSASSGGFSLGLIKGTWNINAPEGDIYLQHAFNPNGLFNDKDGMSYAGYHRFNYDAASTLSLRAGGNIEITGIGAPLAPPSAGGGALPILLPPSLKVDAGRDFVLDQNVVLFPSSQGNLNVATKGNFQSAPGGVFSLCLSESESAQWNPSPVNGLTGTFLPTDHGSSPPSFVDPASPVKVSVGGNMNNVTLYSPKEAQMVVAGNMFNSSLVGQNLQKSDVTSVKVGGSISYSPVYTFTTLDKAIISADPLYPGLWNSIFSLLVDPLLASAFTVSPNATTKELQTAFNQLRALPGSTADSANPGFVYDPATLRLGYHFQMSQYVRSLMEGPLQTVRLDAAGRPVLARGQLALGQDPSRYYFALGTLAFVSPSSIEALYQSSLASWNRDLEVPAGFQIGGPGQLRIDAAAINLGSSRGIISWGVGSGSGAARDYTALNGITQVGASVTVRSASALSMITSTIASVYGGDVDVSAAGQMDLSLGNFAFIPPTGGNIAYGIYTSGHSDVYVSAGQDVNVGSARIGSFNGGNVFVTSLNGNVNAGNGANSALIIPVVYSDLVSGGLVSGTIQSPRPFGSGILALSPAGQYQGGALNSLPGNITVTTPQGDIVSTLGGISQYALNGSVAGGPTVTLIAGSKNPDGTTSHAGNVLLGSGGVVGGTINISAQGNIQGLIVSRQNSTIDAAQSFSGSVLSGGSANLSAGGSVSGTIIGISGVSASAGQGVSADVMGQNVSVNGGASQSTLGTTATATASSQSAAQQASNDSKQVAKNDVAEDDSNKKKGKQPGLVRRVGRVTVILPPKS